jgi:hypothetical protein
MDLMKDYQRGKHTKGPTHFTKDASGHQDVEEWGFHFSLNKKFPLPYMLHKTKFEEIKIWK